MATETTRMYIITKIKAIITLFIDPLFNLCADPAHSVACIHPMAACH